jgi:threonine/homoserine/homoserine lactone efflux protein
MELLAAGFFLSLIGSLPPGLISLTVAHTAIRRGLAAALVLALGAAFAEFFQAWTAVVLSDWFLSHLEIELAFRWVAVLVFFSLGLYLIFFVKQAQTPVAVLKKSLPTQFAKGVSISAVNLLAIPYWFAYCGSLRMEGWWEEGFFSTLFFSAGVTLGTVFALSLYAWLGIAMVHHLHNFARQANRLIGVIFLGLGVKLLWGLLQ